MDALFVNITATGYNPNYCQLTSVITADLSRPPYCGCANEVGTLDEERMVLTALCNSINGRTLVYNNTRAISFITAVCSQYSLEFSPSEIRPLAECLEELEIDNDVIKLNESLVQEVKNAKLNDWNEIKNIIDKMMN